MNSWGRGFGHECLPLAFTSVESRYPMVFSLNQENISEAAKKTYTSVQKKGYSFKDKPQLSSSLAATSAAALWKAVQNALTTGRCHKKHRILTFQDSHIWLLTLNSITHKLLFILANSLGYMELYCTSVCQSEPKHIMKFPTVCWKEAGSHCFHCWGNIDKS